MTYQIPIWVTLIIANIHLANGNNITGLVWTVLAGYMVYNEIKNR